MHKEILHPLPKTVAPRSGIVSDGKPTRPHVSLMEQVRKNLTLSLQELQRMEDEGGNDITPQQTEEIQKLSESIRRLNILMPSEKQGSNPAATLHPSTKGGE